MAKSAKVTGEVRLARGRFDLTRTRAEIQEADGARRTLDHEVYRYTSAAAALLYEPERGAVTLVRQFRMGAYLADGSLDTLEACAGMLDGQTPEDCIRREIVEETGLAVRAIAHAFDFYPSPGGSTEVIHCFFAAYRAGERAGAGGGVDEDEHIEVVELVFADALAMIASGAVRDGKTIALLYGARARGLL